MWEHPAYTATLQYPVLREYVGESGTRELGIGGWVLGSMRFRVARCNILGPSSSSCSDPTPPL